MEIVISAGDGDEFFVGGGGLEEIQKADTRGRGKGVGGEWIGAERGGGYLPDIGMIVSASPCIMMTGQLEVRKS